jgi:excisionase family DNA binding protein
MAAIADGTSFLRLSEASTRFKVSASTLRRAVASGHLKAYRTHGSHRRFREADLLAWLGDSGEDIEQREDQRPGTIPIACCIRVSSSEQTRAQGESQKSSLEHQEDRVRAYVDQRWGASACCTWFKGAGVSGMNFDREDLLGLIDALLAGKFRGGYVVASSPDRIARFGYRMIERIAERSGAKVVYVLEAPEAGADSLTDEILAILTHYTARASGRKAKAVCEKLLPEDALRMAYRWQKAGLSIREIYARLDSMGKAVDVKGRRLSYKSIWRRLNENRAILDKALPEPSLS